MAGASTINPIQLGKYPQTPQSADSQSASRHRVSKATQVCCAPLQYSLSRTARVTSTTRLHHIASAKSARLPE